MEGFLGPAVILQMSYSSLNGNSHWAVLSQTTTCPSARHLSRICSTRVAQWPAAEMWGCPASCAAPQWASKWGNMEMLAERHIHLPQKPFQDKKKKKDNNWIMRYKLCYFPSLWATGKSVTRFLISLKDKQRVTHLGKSICWSVDNYVSWCFR